MFSPYKLLLRVFVTAVIVLWLSHHFQRFLLQPALPLIRGTLEHVQNDFVVQSLDIDDSGINEVIRLHANLAGPAYVNGRVFYPIGWNSTVGGGYEVKLTAGGAMLYSLFTLILVLAWPAADWRALVKRLLLALPLLIGLLLLNTSITFSAELWTPIHDEWVPDMTWGLLVASRMLMGGGGLLLGLLCAMFAIVVGVREPMSINQDKPQIS